MPNKPKAVTRLVCQNSVIPPVGGINVAGFLNDSTGVPLNPMRILGKYAAVYLLRGGGCYRDSNGVDLTVRPGDMILVYPELAHSYGPLAGMDWDEFYIVFDGPVFHAWREAELISSDRPVCHLEPVKYWQHRFVAAAGKSTDGNAAEGLSGLIRMQQLLIDINIALDRELDDGWIATAKSMIDDDAKRRSSNLPRVARHLSISYETFRKRFAHLTGMSPNRYRNGRVMDRAIELLADRRILLRAVAEECGFCDEFHFSRRFKQIMGFSPSEFRKRLK
jgi:AraC-like DNA-binding protein